MSILICKKIYVYRYLITTLALSTLLVYLIIKEDTIEPKLTREPVVEPSVIPPKINRG